MALSWGFFLTEAFFTGTVPFCLDAAGIFAVFVAVGAGLAAFFVDLVVDFLLWAADFFFFALDFTGFAEDFGSFSGDSCPFPGDSAEVAGGITGFTGGDSRSFPAMTGDFLGWGLIGGSGRGFSWLWLLLRARCRGFPHFKQNALEAKLSNSQFGHLIRYLP